MKSAKSRSVPKNGTDLRLDSGSAASSGSIYEVPEAISGLYCGAVIRTMAVDLLIWKFTRPSDNPEEISNLLVNF